MHARSTQKRPRYALALFLAVATACGVHTSQNGAVQITAVNPGTGSITGGMPVTITGVGLDDGTGHATVLFGTSPATVTAVNPDSISATLPAGLACGNTDVQVSNTHGSGFKASAFVYTGGSASISVTGISPAQGVLAGGTPITITGTGFTGGVGVTLGGVPLENITVVSDTQITAQTPVAMNGGEVDLAMRNCGSQASLAKAFIYTTGLNGGFVDMNLTDYLNPAQFATPTPQDYIDPYVVFVEPAAASLLVTLPANGTCTLNPTFTAPSSTITDAGATVQLVSGATTVTLSKQANSSYYFPYDASGNLTSSHYQAASFLKDALYDLDATGGQVPAFTVTGAFRTPGDYTVSAPNISATSPASVSRAAQLAWTWTGAGPGDYFFIELVGYDNTGTSTSKDLFCIANADSATGSYTIKQSDLALMGSTTTQMIVYTNRRKQTPFIIPANGSMGVGVASLYKVGYLLLGP